MTRGLEREGSNLSGVNAKCYWEEIKGGNENIARGNDTNYNPPIIQPPRLVEARRAHELNKFAVLPAIDSNSGGFKQHFKGEGMVDRTSACSSATSEITRTRSCRGVCIRLNVEAASLLPLAFR